MQVRDADDQVLHTLSSHEAQMRQARPGVRRGQA